jgi:hypothetical protein
LLAVPGRCAQGGAAPGVRASRGHEPRTRARRGGQGLLVVARGDTTSDSPGEGAGRRWIRGAAAVAPHARGRPWVRQRRLDEWRRVGGPNRGASPPQWVWSRPAMASVEKGMGERGGGGKRRASPRNDEHQWEQGRRHMKLRRSTRRELQTDWRGPIVTSLRWAASHARPPHAGQPQAATPASRAGPTVARWRVSRSRCELAGWPPPPLRAGWLAATAAASWHEGRGVGVEEGREDGWGVGGSASSTWAPKGGRAVVHMGRRTVGWAPLTGGPGG